MTAKAKPAKQPKPAKDTYKLPSIETLAALAAAMSSPTEEPEKTADRAARLWVVCQDELRRLEWEYEEYLGPGDPYCLKEEAFLLACGLTYSDIEQSGNSTTENILPLETFLKASKPSHDSKPEDMLMWWRAFRERREMGRDSGSRLYAEFTDYQIPTDPNGAISYKSLLPCWRGFVQFIQRDKKAKGDAMREKAKRTKMRRAVASALLAGKKLTKQQLDVLKDVTPAEQKLEVEVLVMDRKQANDWNAAIQDAKPDHVRPKTKQMKDK